MTDEAIAALRAGQAVILPTDTVYGLCALPGREDVLYELKGRDRSKPIALLAADVDALDELVPGVDREVLERYLPRPYTLVVGTPRWASAYRAFPRSRPSVVRAVGVVAATSANLSCVPTLGGSKTSRRRSARPAARSSTPASCPASRPR